MDVTAQTGRNNVKISRREFLFSGRHYYSTTHLIRLQGVVLYKIRQYFLAIFSTMETVPLYILRRLIQKAKLLLFPIVSSFAEFSNKLFQISWHFPKKGFFHAIGI